MILVLISSKRRMPDAAAPQWLKEGLRTICNIVMYNEKDLHW